MKTSKRGIFEKVAGSGVWWVRYVDAQGRYRREKIGTYRAAEKLYHKRKQEALEGKKLPETLRTRGVLFSELCSDTESYIRKHYAQPQHDLGRLGTIKGWFGSRAADSIESKDIEAALDGAKQAGNWSGSSFNHHHTLLSLTFKLAMRDKKIDRNPATGVRRQRENNSRVRFLTDEEETKVRAAIRSNPVWAEHEPEIDLALATGLRRSSMYLHLMWENVNLVGCIARIPQSKNGELIDVPLNRDAMNALLIFRSRGDGTGRVVRNTAGEPLNYPTHWFVPAVRAAGIKGFHWHDLRHTFASRLRQKGVPLANIAELLGHKGLLMTKRYAHLGVSDYLSDVTRIERTSTPVAPVIAQQKPAVPYVN